LIDVRRADFNCIKAMLTMVFPSPPIRRQLIIFTKGLEMNFMANQKRGLNSNSEAVKDLAATVAGKRRVSPQAYCLSDKCTGRQRGGDPKPVPKNVSIKTVDCPDCGHALFWECTEEIPWKDRGDLFEKIDPVRPPKKEAG
jgi:hypothetical protein